MKKSKRNFKCIGCGLCKSEIGLDCSFNEKGFCEVSRSNEQAFSIVNRICPVAGNIEPDVNPWGKTVSTYAGFASDSEIRKKASSGGILSALAIFLLETKQVDGVIQTIAADNPPYKTKSIVSYTRDDVLRCCGSRYSISSPWINLDELIDSSKKYAVVAKPCDIAALRTYAKLYSKFENIKYYLSFFCAGLPSNDAQKKLIRESGCAENNCAHITYRGNGWPGETRISDNESQEYTMKYEYSWGKILGRDVNDFCRVCADGIGCFADVACGDGWYISDNQPDFTEREGRNVIFTRNDIGQKLIEEAEKSGYISVEAWENRDDLKIIQKYQFTRRCTLQPKLCAYKLFGKNVPKYDRRTVRGLAKNSSFREKIKVFLGTVKRIVKGKIR